MDNNAVNNTELFLRAMLTILEEQRNLSKLKSECQFIQCIFEIDDYNDDNSSCRVLPPSDEIEKENTDIELIARYVHLYIYPLIILMGIIGNKLSFLIMLINARRNGYPTSLYLTLLAFIDWLYLMGSAVPEWISFQNGNLNIKLLSDFSCRFVYWFGHFTTHLSAGLVVVVTIERFIAVQYPLVAHKFNTTRRTRLVLIILFVFFFLLDSPVFSLVTKVDQSVYMVSICQNYPNITYQRLDTLQCNLTKRRYVKIWVYLDFAIYNLIPFVIIITLNSSIIRRLREAQRFRQRMFRFNNYRSRQNQSDINDRYCSGNHRDIEMIENYHYPFGRFQSVSETKPLTITLRQQLG